MMSDNVPTSFFCMRLASLPSTICWKFLLSLLNGFGILAENYLTIYSKVYFWTFYFIPLVYISTLCQYYTILISVGVFYFGPHSSKSPKAFLRSYNFFGKIYNFTLQLILIPAKKIAIKMGSVSSSSRSKFYSITHLT